MYIFAFTVFHFELSSLGSSFTELGSLLSLWIDCMWFFITLLVLNNLWQMLHAIEIPSTCIASMCCFMFMLWPSFPQTLHVYCFPLPLVVVLGVLDIMNSIFSSSSELSWSSLLNETLATKSFKIGFIDYFQSKMPITYKNVELFSVCFVF